MTNQVFDIPETISFEAAIATTQKLLQAIGQQRVTIEEQTTHFQALLSSVNGARGFFVVYLSSDDEIAEHPTPEVLAAILANGETVAELMVKNLVMSSAMVLTHQRQGNETMAESSSQVKTRSLQLIEQTKLPQVQAIAQQMLQSVQNRNDRYQDFLERWGYDAQQRQLMAESLQEALSRF